MTLHNTNQETTTNTTTTATTSLATAPTEASPSVLFALSQASVRYTSTERWVPPAATFSVTAKQVVALLGPSGCGKSSLSLLTNGLVPHSVPSVYRGTARLVGKEIADTPLAACAQTVAIVRQDPDAQIVSTRVDREVFFALENLCLPENTIRERAAWALASVGLTEFSDADPWELSGGQRQRLALACALAMKPQFLVLDEATANIDAANAHMIYQLVHRQAREGLGVLLVEHELDRVIGFVDHVVGLGKDGTQIGQGAPEEFFRTHAHSLVDSGVWLPTPMRIARKVPQLSGETPLTFSDIAQMLRTENMTADALLAAWHSDSPSSSDAAFDAKALTQDASSQAVSGLSPSGLSTSGLSASEPEGSRTPAPGLHVRQMRGGYAQADVLHDISFDAPYGTITAVIGVNGAGKSTLMGALAGLNRHVKADKVTLDAAPDATSGTRGDSIALHLGRPNPAIGFVFQNPQHQFVCDTVANELAYGYRLNGLSEADVHAHVTDLLNQFDLSDYAQTSPYELSGGQQRRLSVATTLGEKRRVICFDEPTFGQDYASATRLADLMGALAARGQAVMVASHDMDFVDRYAGHVVVLDAGRVIASGTPAQVFANQRVVDAGIQPPMVYRLAQTLTQENANDKAQAASAGPDSLATNAVSAKEPASLANLSPAPSTPTPTIRPAAPPPTRTQRLFAHLNLRALCGPLTSLLAVIPLMVCVLGTNLPHLCITTMVLASLGIIVLSGRPLAKTVPTVVGIWALTTLLTWSLTFSYVPALNGVGHPVSVAGMVFDSVQLTTSLTKATRIGALVMLVVFSGSTSQPHMLIKALSKYFYLPIRIAYAGIAAISFAQRFMVEHRIIMSARKLRGSRIKSRFAAWVARWFGSVVPLMVSAIRHAENVSMAMDSRAFGAFKKRTECDKVAWTWRDTLLLGAAWVATGLLVWGFYRWGLLGHLYLEWR